MSNDNCGRCDEVIANKVRIDTMDVRQREEAVKHEEYRQAVHKRLTDINNLTNLLRLDVSKGFELCNRRIDGLEHITQNQSELITEFKKFIKETAETFQEIKIYIVKKEANVTGKAQLITFMRKAAFFIFQVGAFALTVIGIIKYLSGDVIL